MRIAIPLETFLYWYGGAERYVYNVSRALVEQGHDVSIYAAQFAFNKPDEQRKQVPCRVVPVPVMLGPGQYPFKQVFRKQAMSEVFFRLAPLMILRDHRLKGRYDVIFSQGAGGMIPLRLRRFADVPFVACSYSLSWGDFDHYRARIFKEADGILTLNQYTLSHFEATMTDLTPYRVVHYGLLNQARFSPSLRDDALRARLGVRDDDLLVLTLQRMDGRKNLYPVLEAFAHVAQSEPHVKFFVGGAGPHKPRYEQWVRENNLSDIITFLGFVPDDELPKLYASSDIFIAANYGYVHVEAMACGTAVLVVERTPQSQGRELMRDGETGLMLPEDSDAVTEALLRLIRNPDLRQSFIQNALRYVVERFDEQRSAQDLVAIFQEAIARHQSRAQ